MRHLPAGLILLTLTTLWPNTARAGIDLWTTAGPLGGRVDSAAVSPAQPDVFYAASHRSVYRSVDAGQTWSEAGAGLFGFELGEIRLSASVTQPGRLLAAGGRSVYLTTSAGASWERSDTGLPLAGSFATSDVVIAKSAPEIAYLASRAGVFRSDDGGANWAQIGDGLPERIERVAVSPLDANLVLVWAGNRDTTANPASLYRSTNGQSFAAVSGPWNADGPIRDGVDLLAFNGNVDGTVFLAGEFGNFRSLDGGQNFSPLPTLPLGPAHRLQAMDYAASVPGWLIFGTSRGVLGSTNNGDTFTLLNSGLGVEGNLPASIGSILFRPGSTSRVVAFSLSADVFASDDGGQAWTAASSGLVGTRIQAVGVHPQLSWLVLAGIGNDRRDSVSAALYGSTDTAASWLRGNTSLALDNINRIAFDPAAPAQPAQSVVYAAGIDFAPAGLAPGDYRGGLFKSTNGGLDWAPADNISPMPQLGPVAMGQVWDIALDKNSAVNNVSQKLFFAASGRFRCVLNAPVKDISRIWFSENAGAGFIERDALPDGVCTTDGRALYPVPRSLLLFAENATPFLFAGTMLKDFCADCGDGSLATPNGVFLSTDLGQNWIPRNSGLPITPEGTLFDVASLIQGDFSDIIVALNPPGDPRAPGRIFRSSDKGLNWVPYDDGLSGGNVRALIYDDPGGGRLFAALDGSPTNPGGVFVRPGSGTRWLPITIGLPPDSANSLAISTPATGRPTFHLGTDRGVWSLTKLPDADRDGPSDDDENLSPNAGDGNSDGIKDRNQSDVASIRDLPPGPLLKSPMGAAKRATIGNINLRHQLKGYPQCTQILDVHQPPLAGLRADTGFSYPAGIYRFEFENCQGTQVEIIFHDDIFPSFAEFRRFGPQIVGDELTMRWLPMGSSAQRTANGWILTISDNEPGDLRSDVARILFLGGPALMNDVLFLDGFESP